MARAMVRGADPEWLHEVYGFALRPDAIFYLRVQIDDLVTRVLQSTGFDYWESGMDMHMGEDMYESFVRYQKFLLAEFDKMVETHGFEIVDFFFSSRRRHTRWNCDWSSDVCSSDLRLLARGLELIKIGGGGERSLFVCGFLACDQLLSRSFLQALPPLFTVNIGRDPSRSEERRVGKECRSRWSPSH